MKQTASLFMFVVIGLCCEAQVKEEEVSPDLNTWAARVGIGIQKSPYAELAITRLWITSDGLNWGSNALYAAVEINRKQNSSDPVYYGFKTGFETSWGVAMGAIELKYVTDLNHEDVFVLTPKAGLTVFGAVNLLYGYNFPKNLDSFSGIGNHQFSLVVHVSRKLIAETR